MVVQYSHICGCAGPAPPVLSVDCQETEEWGLASGLTPNPREAKKSQTGRTDSKRRGANQDTFMSNVRWWKADGSKSINLSESRYLLFWCCPMDLKKSIKIRWNQAIQPLCNILTTHCIVFSLQFTRLGVPRCWDDPSRVNINLQTSWQGCSYWGISGHQNKVKFLWIKHL